MFFILLQGVLLSEREEAPANICPINLVYVKRTRMKNFPQRPGSQARRLIKKTVTLCMKYDICSLRQNGATAEEMLMTCKDISRMTN